MNAEVRGDILSILKQVLNILAEKEEKDVLELKELSDHTIHNSSIYQDEDSITIAVVVYAIYKIIDRGVPASLYTKLQSKLNKTEDFLKDDDIQNYRLQIREIIHSISSFDKKLKRYIEDVIDKARINKGSKVFEHGISLGRAAEMLGITHWELMNYVGKTHFTEVKGLDVRKRLDFAESLFGIKK